MAPQSGGLDIEVTNFPVPTEKWFPTGEDLSIPAPLNQLVDVNLERRSVVYEVTLGREIGIEILQGPGGPVVGQVRRLNLLVKKSITYLFSDYLFIRICTHLYHNHDYDVFLDHVWLCM